MKKRIIKKMNEGYKKVANDEGEDEDEEEGEDMSDEEQDDDEDEQEEEESDDLFKGARRLCAPCGFSLRSCHVRYSACLYVSLSSLSRRSYSFSL